MQYVQTAPILDASAYIAALPELERTLPRRAHRFAADADHYDFGSLRCVHDLELGAIQLIDEPGGPVELRLVGNRFKHDEDLVIRYFDVRSIAIETGDERPMGHRVLGDVMLDEILPLEGGIAHEIVFESGTLRLVAGDLWARWVPAEVTAAAFVFTPAGGHYPAGIWSSHAEAQRWISHQRASGMLSKYDVGRSAYDSNVSAGLLKVDRPQRETSAFISNFTTALDHWHYADGSPA